MKACRIKKSFWKEKAKWKMYWEWSTPCEWKHAELRNYSEKHRPNGKCITMVTR